MTLRKLYPPQLLDTTLEIAEHCSFSLQQLHYEYPEELVPQGHTPSTWLRELTEKGAQYHWPAGVPKKVTELIEKELALIQDLGYEAFFLTVHELVNFARKRNIL